jgi:hypothetical protein
MRAPPGRKLTPIQLAYLSGYRRAMNAARKDLHDMARRFDGHLGELQDDYEKVIKQMRAEQSRYNQIDAALRAKPSDDDIWLQ